MRILLAEDEQDLNSLIARRLTAAGYSVDRCHDGQEALDCLELVNYDALILDIMMPRVDGWEVLRRLRHSGSAAPVLLLTARDAVADRVRGLDSGANDYLIKPFSFEELLARLRAITRAPFGLTGNQLRLADLTLDLAAHTVQRAGREIALSAREYALMECLMRNQGVVLTREQIEDHIWNFDYEGGTNVVDVYISYLRKKIDEGQAHKLIHTVRGSGYVLRESR